MVRTLVKSGAIAKSALSTTAKPDDPIRIPPEHAEEVAKALRTYLAMSGQYSYSLNLERQDDRCDPAEDFLLNTKVGHCQRFATALALMLRSVGIPSRIVLGYRGFESDGFGGLRDLAVQCACMGRSDRPASAAKVRRLGTGSRWIRLRRATIWWPAAFRSRLVRVAAQHAVTFYRYFVVEYDSDQQAAPNWFERIDWPATLVGPDGNAMVAASGRGCRHRGFDSLCPPPPRAEDRLWRPTRRRLISMPGSAI